MTMTRLNWFTFDQLSTSDLYEILRLRSEVFVVEQECAYQDLDGKDFVAEHLMGYDGKHLMGTARILPVGAAYADAISIGRITVGLRYRNQHLGQELVTQAIARCRQLEPTRDILIGAQARLQGFYQSLGFIAEGTVYDEDDIDHITMRLAVGTNSHA